MTTTGARALTGTADLPAVLAGLVTSAHETADRAALVMADGRRLTNAALLERVQHAAAGFSALGIGRGARTVVLTPPAPDFMVVMFALLACGAVPVLIDPGIGPRRVRAALPAVAPVAFVGSRRAHVARRLLGLAPTARHLVLTEGDRPSRSVTGSGVVSLDDVERAGRNTGTGWRPQADAYDAALLFTSGSTGAPKAAVYRHPHFAAQLAALRTTYDLRPGEVTVATFPPFALFGPALGQTTVLPTMDFTRPASADPTHLRAVVADHRADLLFASPALLASLAHHGRPLPSLRLVLSAGAPVPTHVVAAIDALLPDGAAVSTPYGMTEALPVSAIAGDELRAAAGLHDPPRGVCVGRPVPGTAVTVVGVDDAPLATIDDAAALPDGQVGELVVAGPQVTESYVDRPDATARAKTTWDGRTAHRTGDLAWRDAQGRLWFCGRTVHRVRTDRGPLDPLPVEQLVLDHPHVWRAALVGVPDGAVQRPVLVVQHTADATSLLRRWSPEGRARRRALVADLRARLDAHPHGAAVSDVLLRSRMPVDARHNAKIGYEQLARWVVARERRRPAWVGRRAFGGGAT
ncbi:MAG TPA: fatty acid CoA ligase family protein [Euzebyales bacterium]